MTRDELSLDDPVDLALPSGRVIVIGLTFLWAGIILGGQLAGVIAFIVWIVCGLVALGMEMD